jgi:hypothetical protein
MNNSIKSVFNVLMEIYNYEKKKKLIPSDNY